MISIDVSQNATVKCIISDAFCTLNHYDIQTTNIPTHENNSKMKIVWYFAQLIPYSVSN